MIKKKKEFQQVYFKGLSPTSVRHTVIEETVKEILRLAEKELGKPAKDLTVLDVGSGWGEYVLELANHTKEVVGVEPYKKLYEEAIKNKKPNVNFFNALIEDFTYGKKFDLVISLTTIEHMPNVIKSFTTIYKLMKDKSLLYVTAPNKLWPLEPHYRLPFLSYLPLSIANPYLKMFRKVESFEDSSYALTYFQTKKLFSSFNWKYSFVLPDPKAVYLGCGEDSSANKLIKKVGIGLIKRFSFFWIFSKGFIIIAKKGK